MNLKNIILSKRKKDRHKKEYIKTFIHIKIHQQAKLNYILKEYVRKFDQTLRVFKTLLNNTQTKKKKN